MQLTAVVLSALFAATQVSAFTNGSLVPPYICNPNADGLPKSFAQLLPYTRKQLQKVAFDAKAGDNDNNLPQVKQAGINGNIGNSAYVLASFHNSLNNLNSLPNGIKVATANGGPLVAGQANQLTISSSTKGTALGGVLIYGKDATGARQGSITDKGNTFVQFPGCGLNQQNQVAAMIQQQGVSATGTYSQLFYNAPANAAGQLTLSGLFVTGAGFGIWNQTFQVTGGSGTGTGAGNGGGNAAASASASGANAANGAATNSATAGTATSAAAKGAKGASTAATAAGTSAAAKKGAANASAPAGTSAAAKKAAASGTAKKPCAPKKMVKMRA